MNRPLAARTPRFAVTGRLADLGVAQRARLLERGRATDPDVARETAALIGRVRDEGDAALHDFAARFDRVTLDRLDVPRVAWSRALDSLEPAVRKALQRTADAIATVHRAQRPAPIVVDSWPGVRVTRVFEPLARVGVYVPGGRAAYPSSVLMGVVPARVAGVDEVVVCSPPGAGGQPPASVLAACAIAGADRVFAIGGAGAVAALAYGTATVPRVDRIVGPGNAWVTEAKRQLNGRVGIDCPAGPSEILIVADSAADVATIAAEMIAQAEHDPDAAALLVTTEASHLESVPRALEAQLGASPRRSIVEASFAANGALLAVADTQQALAFASEYAAEHVLLLVRDARAAAAGVRGAGTVFLGAASSVTFGDYVTGANHVLPTGAQGRFFSGLSTLDFGRWTTWQEVSDDGAARLAPLAATLADAEGLPGHAAAARLRGRAGDVGPAPSARPLPLRPEYAELRTYDPGRVPCDTDLSDNTNLFGVPPAARAALEQLRESNLTRYPAVYADRLRERFAAVLGVAADQVTTGCGSDDVIDSVFRAFGGSGARVAYPEPTFGMVPAFARMNALPALPVPLRPDLELDHDALLRTGADLLYLCRPNNPTGTLFQRATVESLLEHAPGIVVIDEAYADFAGDDMIEPCIRSGRAIVLRTLSKAYGLAGLRVGFAVGPQRLVAEIEKSRGPYKVSATAEAAALAALEHDLGWVREHVAHAVSNRDRLAQALRAHGYAVHPSAANFVLVTLPAGAAARDVARALRERGVAIRPFALDTLGECVRVTIGPWPLLERFLDAFTAAVPPAGAGS